MLKDSFTCSSSKKKLTSEMKVKRTHDDLYLSEKRYKKPKQSFLEFLKLIKPIKNKNILKVLDIGCANGELISNLNRNYNFFEIVGYDTHTKLINLCKSKFNKFARFKKVDIAKKINIKEKFDIVIISGVISIFDSLDIIFKNLIKLLNKKGKIFIFNHFNEYPIEVLIKYRTNDKNSRFLQSGWNIHSIAKIKRYFERVGFKIKQHKFRPIKGIKRHRKDPVRSWTFKNDKKENLITNGLSILQNQFWLEIYR